MNTHITLTEAECAVRFHDGSLLVVKDDGMVRYEKGTLSFDYEPPRLKRRTEVESAYGSQRTELDGGVALNIRTERGRMLRIEIFFEEREADRTVVSGCFLTKENSNTWAITFVDIERFLSSLSSMLNAEDNKQTGTEP
jgi:hypothetical protein